MIGELIVLGKIVLTITLAVGGILLFNFIKSIFNTIILPVIQPIMEVLGRSIRNLLEFLEDATRITTSLIISSLKYLRSKLLGIVSNYKRINKQEVQMHHEVYTLENEAVKCTTIQVITNLEDLPEEIRNNLEQTRYMDKELINESLLKLKNTGVNYV